MQKHLSILTFEPSSTKRLVITIWIFLLIFFLSIIGLNLWVDPYFIFRSTPFEPRLELVDSRQRFVKSLQVITRQPNTIILGSSRVYRGFDVKGSIYNMGVSSLTLTEAAAYTDHILRFTKVRNLVLGLDFWMCDIKTSTQVDWDENIGTIHYTIQSFLNVLLKPNEAFGILKSYKESSPEMAKARWTYEGFFHTENRSKTVVDKMLCSYKNYFEDAQIDLKSLSLFEHIIYQCQSKRVKLYVYISPIHPSTKAIYMHSKAAFQFAPWRKKIQELCDNNNIPFHDFTDLLQDSPPLTKGSTELWLDYSHFSPKVGSTILRTLGIREGT